MSRGKWAFIGVGCATICIATVVLQTASPQGGPAWLTIKIIIDTVVTVLASTAAVCLGLALTSPTEPPWAQPARAGKLGIFMGAIGAAVITGIKLFALQDANQAENQIVLPYPLTAVLDVLFAILEWTSAFLLAISLIGLISSKTRKKDALVTSSDNSTTTVN